MLGRTTGVLLSILIATTVAFVAVDGSAQDPPPRRTRTDRDALMDVARSARACVQTSRAVRVTVRARIAAPGDVAEVTVEGPVRDAALACVRDHIRRAKFQASSNARTLTFPLVFRDVS